MNLEIIEKQADFLWRNGIEAVFIGGTTGESHSLTFAERSQLAAYWMNVTRHRELQVIINASSSIPNFAGIKFTNADLIEYQLCQNATVDGQ